MVLGLPNSSRLATCVRVVLVMSDTMLMSVMDRMTGRAGPASEAAHTTTSPWTRIKLDIDRLLDAILTTGTSSKRWPVNPVVLKKAIMQPYWVAVCGLPSNVMLFPDSRNAEVAVSSVDE